MSDLSEPGDLDAWERHHGRPDAADADEARRVLRRRSSLLDWFQIGFLVLIPLLCVWTLAVAHHADKRASDARSDTHNLVDDVSKLSTSVDRLTASQGDTARLEAQVSAIAEAFRRLATATTPAERQQAIDALNAIPSSDAPPSDAPTTSTTSPASSHTSTPPSSSPANTTPTTAPPAPPSTTTTSTTRPLIGVPPLTLPRLPATPVPRPSSSSSMPWAWLPTSAAAASLALLVVAVPVALKGRNRKEPNDLDTDPGPRAGRQARRPRASHRLHGPRRGPRRHTGGNGRVRL